MTVKIHFHIITIPPEYRNKLSIPASGHLKPLYLTIPSFNDHAKKPFKNNVKKGENAGNQHFLLYPHCFLLSLEQILPFVLIVIYRL